MKSLAKFAAATALALPGIANAAATFNGNFIGVSINDIGTLSSLKHDPAGGGSYGLNDYITPGNPHDGFSVNSVQTGFRQNSNDGPIAQFTGGPTVVLAGAAALGYDFAAGWTGANALLSINNRYFYNDGDERIRVITTLTALGDLTDLAFARSVDPDPDVLTGGGFATNNQRGNMMLGVTDFVGSAGPASGLTLALVNNSGNTYTHNTRIDPNCCDNIDPNTVLGGGVLSSTGDHSLNMAWLIGGLTTGNSRTIEYFYVVGDNIEVIGGGVPEPATWAMMIMGFGFVGGSMRYRKRSTKVAFAR